MADFNFYINRQGIQGRKGEKGETGFSPAISVGTDTPNEYKLIIANESNSFETPNLRGNINVLDNGGTYLRYDAETQQISAQGLDAATSSTLGGVVMSTDADIEGMGDGSVITPADLADALPIYLQGEGAVTITQDEETSKTKINVDLSSVDDLTSRVSAAEAEIVGIQADVADLDADNTDNKAIIDAHTNSIADINDSIASLQQNKQAKLTAGEGITIDENNIISSIGGGGAGDVTAAGNNVFTGTNRFNDTTTFNDDVNLYNYQITLDESRLNQMFTDGSSFTSYPSIIQQEGVEIQAIAPNGEEAYHYQERGTVKFDLAGSFEVRAGHYNTTGNILFGGSVPEINLYALKSRFRIGNNVLTYTKADGSVVDILASIDGIGTILDNINGEVI